MRRSWLAVMVVAAVASAEPDLSPARVTLGQQPTELLDRQIQVVLPEGMQSEVRDRASGVLAATRDHQRYTLDLDGLRFTMLAYETYASMGTDFSAAIKADLGAQGVPHAKVQKLDMESPLVAYEAVPAVPSSTLDTWVLVYAAYIATPQATVDVLAFYVADDELRFASAWAALSRRIAMSAGSGARPVDLAAREVRIADLVVPKPRRWALLFQVHQSLDTITLRKIAPLGSSAPSCTLYETSDPERSPADTREIDDTLLGEQVVWREWTDHDSVVTRVTLPRGARSTDVVVTCRARGSAELPAVRAIFRSLRAGARP